jgi:hypothetical protein
LEGVVYVLFALFFWVFFVFNGHLIFPWIISVFGDWVGSFIVLGILFSPILLIILRPIKASKDRKFRKELDEKMRINQERINILKNLGLFEFYTRINPDPQLHFDRQFVTMTDNEFNNLLQELKSQKENEEEYKKTPVYKVIESIQNFKPTKKWGNEDSYHKELLGWLKHPFPEIEYELQKGSSRPDLVISNIAIEIKGPTDDQALNTLATKILKYHHYYDHIVIVLFETQFSERNYREILDGIEKTYPNVKVVRK